MIDLGDRLPALECQATGDQTIHLPSLHQGPLLIFFYPRASTPGCTREAEGFRDHHAAFQQAGCAVLGASRDSLRAQQRFADKLQLPYPLLADPEETLCNAFGVIGEKMMYGKTVRGIQRSTFLFDAKGELVEQWRKVKVPGHVEAVLEAAKALD